MVCQDGWRAGPYQHSAHADGALHGRERHLGVRGAVKWLTGVEALPGPVRFRAEAVRRYLVVSAEGLLAPRVAHPEPSTLRSVENQADYLLIAPESFLSAAEPLLARRTSQGLTTKAVSLEEIATVFGHGPLRPFARRSGAVSASCRATRPRG